MKGILKRLFGRERDPDATGAHKTLAPHRWAPSRAKQTPNREQDGLDLTLEGADSDREADHYDPYNTGSFDRGTSWDKNRRRKNR